MDSIQGKMDQFSNAVQSMWKNTLDAEWVKLIVDAGTGLVKLVDNIGLLQTALFGLFTYLSNKKNSNFDLASILGIHDKEKGWTVGQEGVTGWIKDAPGKIKEKFKKRPIVEDIKVDAKEYAEAIGENINDYVTIDTSKIDTQIEDVQNKLMVAREQLAEMPKGKEGWNFYKSMGSDTPAKDRDNRIADKQQEIKNLEQQLSDLETRKDKIVSSASAFATIDVNNIKAETQEYRSLFDALDKVKNVKLSIGNEQDAALKIDQINQAAAQGEVALSKYASTLGDSDVALQAYIASLNGEKASLAGFNQFINQHNAGVKASGVAAKAASIGHAALNAAISMGISLLISGAISAIMSWVNAAEEMADAAKDAMNAYADANSTLRDHKKTIDSIKDDYQKLADGVDDLGNNVNLTTEEYERYNEITNQIADMFPHLIAGYTEEGNAIIKMKGNVEALTDAYEKEARAARDAVLAESKSVVKDSHNTIKNGFWSESDGFWKSLGKSTIEDFGWHVKASTTNLNAFSKYVNGDSSALGSSEYGLTETEVAQRVLQTLKDAGADVSFWDVDLGDKETLDRVIEENRDIVQSVLNTVDQEIQTAAANNRSIIDAYLGNNDQYKGLDDESKSLIKQVVQNLDDEFLTSFKSNTELFGWVQDNLVGQFRDLDSDAQKQIQLGFGLMTKFNNGEVTVAEYEAQIQSIINLIDALDLENEDEILKSFRIAFNIDEDGKVDASKQNVVKNILKDEFDANVVNLTKDDLDIVDQNLDAWNISDGTLLSWDELTEKIATAKAMTWEAATDFETVSKSLDNIQDAYSALSSAVTEYNTNGFLTLDSLQSILSLEPEYLAALQMENGQLSINQTVMEGIIQTRLAEAKATVIQSAMEQLHALAAKTAADEVNNSATAAGNAVSNLGAYSSALGTVAKDAIAAAGAVTALNAAVSGAQANEFVNQSEIDTILSNMNNSLSMIDELGAGLSTNFGAIVGTDKDKNGADDNKEDAVNEAFQREMDYWENRIGANQARYEQLQNEIDLLEAKGQKADASFYEEQIELENQRLFLLGEQKKAAQTYLADLEEGSEQWWEVANVLNDLESDIDDVTASLVDLQDAIAEIDTYKFEEFNTRLDNLIGKLETLRNLIAPDGEEDWFDSEGAWTEAGVAVLGSQLQQLEMYKQGYQETMDELAKYEPDYEGNKSYYEALGIHSEQEWYEKTEELISQQYDFAESISDTEQSVVDMYESSIDAVEEYTETLIDSYNDYIDSVKEALDAERDLYNFKKNVQKQTKDIAALERRIASLSGSTNASDIAERRRLEADLYGAREELDDTYYEHAKDAQSEALDREAEAYEESMNNMIEGLRTSLETASMNMDEFLMGVTSMVMYNADTVLSKYEETNLPLTTELTNPWIKAKEAVGAYSGDALALMNKWTEKGGFFAQFNATGTTNLQSPWNAGTTAANAFKNSVSTAMSGVVSNISSNVRTASGELSKLYQQIQDTEMRAANANVATTSTSSTPSGGSSYTAPKKYYVSAFLDMGGRSLSVTKSGSTSAEAMSAAKIAILGEYEKVKGNSMSAESAWQRTWRNKVKYTTQYYANGTTGVDKDQWAITDEPQFGDELVLVPGKDGNLSFVRKGTGIVPADMTQKLFELAQIPMSDLMNKSLTAIVPNITKNDFKNEFNFESLVHVDKVDSDTLPKLEKMVDKKIDDFSKALNYSIKKFAR